MLRPGSTERNERVVARVIAFGNGDGADCLGHLGVGDANETLRQIKRWRAGGVSLLVRIVTGVLTHSARPNRRDRLCQSLFSRLSIKRKWKMFRQDPTE